MSTPHARQPRRPRTRGHHARGVSLVEMLIGVTLLSVLLTLAAPSFTDFIRKSRLTSSVSMLVSDLNYARGEAIMRNAPVIVCARVANANTCANTTNWQSGWVVCVDANADGACDTATTNAPNPLRVRSAVSTTTVITAGISSVRFSSVGAVTTTGAFTVAGGPPTLPSRSIAVTSNGYVRTY